MDSIFVDSRIQENSAFGKFFEINNTVCPYIVYSTLSFSCIYKKFCWDLSHSKFSNNSKFRETHFGEILQHFTQTYNVILLKFYGKFL